MTTKHRHPLYVTWRNMLARCYNPKYQGYRYYVEQGIEVCDEWQRDFWAFASHVGDKPTPKHTLDRIKNEQGYEPGNVRWATMQEQRRNTRAASGIVGGLTLDEASAATGLRPMTIYTRLRSGLAAEDALAMPTRAMSPKNSVLPPGAIKRCAELGINVRTISIRMKKGMSFEDAISKPMTRPGRPR